MVILPSDFSETALFGSRGLSLQLDRLINKRYYDTKELAGSAPASDVCEPER